MRLAIEAANEAAAKGEVPVGAVIIQDGEILATAGNSPISQNDPTGHAEIRAIRLAAEKLNNYRLVGTTLYVTLEPCLMCMGAIIHARIERLVYGATDPKGGAVVSLYPIGDDSRLNHKVEINGGIMGDECGIILRDFFRQRRK